MDSLVAVLGDEVICEAVLACLRRSYEADEHPSRVAIARERLSSSASSSSV